LLLDVDQRVEGLVQAQPLARGEVELSPPFPVVGGEGVTGRGVDVVAIEGANLSPQPTALSWRFARRDLPAIALISGVDLPGSGGGWAPGR